MADDEEDDTVEELSSSSSLVNPTPPTQSLLPMSTQALPTNLSSSPENPAAHISTTMSSSNSLFKDPYPILHHHHHHHHYQQQLPSYSSTEVQHCNKLEPTIALHDSSPPAQAAGSITQGTVSSSSAAAAASSVSRQAAPRRRYSIDGMLSARDMASLHFLQSALCSGAGITKGLESKLRAFIFLKYDLCLRHGLGFSELTFTKGHKLRFD